MLFVLMLEFDAGECCVIVAIFACVGESLLLCVIIIVVAVHVVGVDLVSVFNHNIGLSDQSIDFMKIVVICEVLSCNQ